MCLCLKVTCQLNKDLNICYRWSEVKNGSEFTVVKEVFAFFVDLICIASLHVCHTNTSDCQNFNIQGWFKKMQSADFKMINWFVKVDKFYPNIPGHTWGKMLTLLDKEMLFVFFKSRINWLNALIYLINWFNWKLSSVLPGMLHQEITAKVK